jgi:hypothetical protein
MRVFVAIVGLFQLLACIAWAVWMVPHEESLPQYVAFVPPAMLFIGAVACALAARRMGKDKKLRHELWRLRSHGPTDENPAEQVKTGLETYQTLRDWGIITENEFLERRSALLGLERPPSAKS